MTMSALPLCAVCCVLQATLTACQAALTGDIDTVGASTYYGTTDSYRRQVAAGLLYKVRAARFAVPWLLVIML